MQQFRAKLCKTPECIDFLKKSTQSPSQSATFILVYQVNLRSEPDIFWGSGTLKKSGPKYGPEESCAQKTGSMLFKKRRGSMAFFFFLNNNDPVFCNQLFSGPYFGSFSGSQTDPCFQNKNSGSRLTGLVFLQILQFAQRWIFKNMKCSCRQRPFRIY